MVTLICEIKERRRQTKNYMWKRNCSSLNLPKYINPIKKKKKLR